MSKLPSSSLPSSPEASTTPQRKGAAGQKQFPGYPISPRVAADESPALSPEQIPLTQMDEMELPNDVETAEALGLGRQELSDEITEEERQHHPDQQGDVEHATGLAEELDRRIAGNSR